MGEFKTIQLIPKFFLRLGRAYKQLTNPIAYIARRFIRCAGGFVAGEGRHQWCLDIGAGIAPYEKEICRNFNIERYLPIDVSVSDRTEVLADGGRLPFRSGSVHLVVIFDVIQHVPCPEDMLREVSRVLIPGGNVILTFPFLYPECDVHDFRRWTMEGIEQILRREGLDPVLMEHRGGACFALACNLTWTLQHLIPGQRRSWRATHSWAGFVRETLVLVLILPARFIAWVALMVDLIVGTKGAYMGGSVLAQKRASADSLDKCA
jgi:SAM-dependent methyltransferase